MNKTTTNIKTKGKNQKFYIFYILSFNFPYESRQSGSRGGREISLRKFN